MKKKLLAALFAMALPSLLMAVPAKRNFETKVQPDGTKIQVTLCGDENFSFYRTSDGIPVQKDDNGAFRYLLVDKQGNFKISDYLAHEAAERTQTENNLISSVSDENFQEGVTTRVAQSPYMRSSKAIGNFPTQGEVRGLIILVEFNDLAMKPAHTQAAFHNMMNQEGYSDYNADGSARDYFLSQSHGQFIPTFDVVGPVKLSKNMADYGGNDYYGQDKNPDGMVVEACRLAKSQFNVDFSNYDLDEDGIVDLVYVIYAGYGEAQGGGANTIWPHKWSIAHQGLTLDGKSFDSYACSCELSGSSGSVIDGIGTFCHEFSHCLGLPDLYDTANSGNFGMGYWDLMGIGCYLNDSRTPPSYSAFERSFVDWIELEELTEPKSIELSALTKDNKAYVLYNPMDENEFITFENRQLEGWDSYLPNHGMLITRVKYDNYIWNSNKVNAIKGKQYVKIFPADNVQNVSSGNSYWTDMAGDVYPGTARNTEFTSTSTPKAAFFDGTVIDKPVTRIAEDDGIITFDFLRPEIAIPTANDASEVTTAGFMANWAPMPNAESYVLDVYTFAPGERFLYEDFSKFIKGSVGSPNSMDISSSLDTYTQQPGWAGSRVFQAGQWAKIGSLSAGGYLTSPMQDLSSIGGHLSVFFKLKANSATDGGISVILSSDIKGNNVVEQYTYDIVNGETTIKTNFKKGTENCYVVIKPKSIVYVTGLNMYTGDIEDEPSHITEFGNEKSVYSDIAGTNHYINNVDTDKVYNYRVRGKVGEFLSDYSNPVLVDVNNLTNLINPNEELKSQIHITTVKSAIHITTVKSTQYKVFSASGNLIKTEMISAGEHSIPVQDGFYIVTVDDKAQSVIVTQ